MIKKISKVPDPVLYKKTQLITEFDQKLESLVFDMIETCQKAEGIGLAAPQVGLSLRLCIINLVHLGIAPFALINPKITSKSWKKIEMEEGCLSIPGVYGTVKRPKKITVVAQNLLGKKVKLEADDLMSRVIQHEIDHLDGILFTTKMNRQTHGQPLENM
jgi:peptide deformylase